MFAAFSQTVPRIFAAYPICSFESMFAAYLQNVRRIFAAYSVSSFESMFAAYSQNGCRIFTAYPICTLGSCSLNVRRIFAGCSHKVFAANLICM